MRIIFSFLIALVFTSVLSANDGQRIWVYFKDKGQVEIHKIQAIAQSHLSERSVLRRMRQGKVPPLDYSDLPVQASYLQKLQQMGFIVYRQSKWLNAVSGWADENTINTLHDLPFVLKIEKVRRYTCTNRYEPCSQDHSFLGKTEQNEYGPSENQDMMIGIPQAHNMGFHGQGVRIALFDTGFLLHHDALQNVKVMASWDFVQGDSTVANEQNDAASQQNHGTEVLAVIAGYKPSQLIGPAYGAEYLLAKTELVTSETHLEEDNWVAAAEWADSLGTDIISTSLGYSTFDSGQVNYTYADMDGNTTIITRAADLAVSKGIAVFAAAGNEGNNTWHYITAPADGDSVIAVGGVQPDGAPWSTSSYGPTADGRIKPDLVAQGQAVYTINPASLNLYSYASGTSMACPLAAGAAAILLSADSTLTPMQLRELMTSTASRAQNPDNKMGYGLINLEKSLARILDGRVVQLTGFTSYSTAGRNVLNWSVNSSMKIKEWIIARQRGEADFNTIGYLQVPVDQIYPANFSFADLDISGGEVYRYRLQVELVTGNIFSIDTLLVQSSTPQQVGLYQNFPNPFNTTTQIIFSLPTAQQVNLKVYERTGRLVKILIDDSILPPAFYHYFWDGTTTNGTPVASGVYYIVLSTPSGQKVIKGVFLK
jgi:serine protease AprX